MGNSEQFYLSDKNLAKRWGISFRTLQRWRWKGTGPPYVKIGGRIRYRLDNITKFEEENWHQDKSQIQTSWQKVQTEEKGQEKSNPIVPLSVIPSISSIIRLKIAHEDSSK